MADPAQLKILKKGDFTWNKWRGAQSPQLKIDLSNSDLSRTNLSSASLIRANLSGANLFQANLAAADLSAADLSWADLSGANLFGVKLYNTTFNSSMVEGSDFTKCSLSRTAFSNLDMSEMKGLETIGHDGPSSVGIDTLFLSKGKIPEVFLRGCGVPEDLIAYLPSLIGAGQSIQFYSCFISYNTQDEEFARRLHSRMLEAKLRVWFAPEDIKAGQKLFDQVEMAIQLHDRLLLVLSENSMKSDWVFTEIRRAFKAEKRENRRKLFPIRLVDFEKVQEWVLFDPDTGKDLALEIRQYYIPDFSNWKDHDSFEKSFNRLLQDLKAEEK